MIVELNPGERKHRKECQIPWWSSTTIKIMDKLLTKDMRVFEWGSGYSTLWLAERVKEVFSMEHNGEWVREISDLAFDKNINNIHFFHSGGIAHRYFTYITEHDPFDCIIIDGRERVKCFNIAIDCLAPGGFIMLDDSGRDRYDEINNTKMFKNIIPLCDNISKTDNKYSTMFWGKNDI